MFECYTTVKLDACSISRSSRCSFTANAIHVPDLCNCMSNQKIVLLLHFIRVIKSFTFDIIGPLMEPMCCVSSFFIHKKKEKKKKGKGSLSCNSARNVFSLWHFYKFTMKTDHAKRKLIRHIAGLEMLFWVPVLLQHL